MDYYHKLETIRHKKCRQKDGISPQNKLITWRYQSRFLYTSTFVLFLFQSVTK